MEVIRDKELKILSERLKYFPVVAILGPRQCGKTTLARQFAHQHPAERIHTFDLEDTADLAKLENPTLTLAPLTGIVIIDEVQRRPNLFPTLRVLVDKHPKAKYLLLGSASGDLLAQTSESLAGRISYLELSGFTLESLPEDSAQKLWIRGGFPKSFLAPDEKTSFTWRRELITTFLERDIPNLGIRIPAEALRRFWTMLGHYHGQVFNASEIGRSLGISEMTSRRYLDILSATFLIRQIQPWFYNTKKRIIKRPKIYFRDSGILHALSSLEDLDHLLSHPKLGASWEGFALEQAVQHLNLRQEEVFFWGLHTGGELDFVFQHQGKLWGVEAKYSEAPTLTPSMRKAHEELSLAHLWVLYPGSEEYPLDKRTSAVPLRRLKSIRF